MTDTSERVSDSISIEQSIPALKDILPADLAADPSISKFADAASLAKSYMHLESKRGTMVSIPSENSSEEDRADFISKISKLDGILVKPSETDAEALKAFKAKLGVPNSSEDYKYVFEEGYKLPLDDKAMKEFNKFAFDHDLTQAQADKILRTEIARKEKEIELAKASELESEEKLKAAWGEAFDDKMNNAKAALEIFKNKMGTDIEQLEKSGLLKNPALLMMLSDIGQISAEKAANGVTYKPTTRTPDEARSEIDKILRNPDHPYLNEHHRDHRKACELVQKLYQQAST